MRKLNLSEKIVKRYLEQYSFHIKPIEPSRALNVYKPDFYGIVKNEDEEGGVFSSIIEVKEIKRPAIPDEPTLHKTIFNKITSDIDHAIKQFDSENKKRKIPNILAWVCDDPNIYLDYIKALYEKRFVIADDQFFDISKAFTSEPRYTQLFKIDLHLFVAIDESFMSYYISTKHKQHFEQLVLSCQFMDSKVIDSGK